MRDRAIPTPIRLKCRYALGDIVVLTAAVRDLHHAYPEQYRVSVDTSSPEVWLHNPYVRPRRAGEQLILCDNIKIDRQGTTGRHYVHAYLDAINQKLGTQAEITAIKGDIHLSQQEKSWHSDIWSLCDREIPFWLISSGGKFDLPIKWWDHERYQQVINAFRGKIQFVQVGTWGNHHPKLEGTIDLRGQTSVRDLIHLMYYAKGVVCGVTSLMHLAAAVPTELSEERPAIIIGGAREPATWEAYPGHEYISSARSVSCGNCWKSQVSGSRDACVTQLNDLPACMGIISAEDVIERIDRLHGTGRIDFLKKSHLRYARRASRRAAESNSFEADNITALNACAQAEKFIASIPEYPHPRFSGRGVVICGGGPRYFPLTWICIRMLRKSGCTLPIQVWHYGKEEIDRKMANLLIPFGVECVDAHHLSDKFPMRNPLGWELKAYALLHSSFREVLLLDADNVPIRNPEYLFDCPDYRTTGAIFWPDYGRLSPKRRIWRLCGVTYRDEPEFESGQMVIEKQRCWQAIMLAWWYNDHSEFFYRHIHGDKDTFHMAWRRLALPYSMPPYPIQSFEGTMCQHDFDGNRIFQHRNTPKFVLDGENRRVPGFEFEDLCLSYLEELRTHWNGRIGNRVFTEEKHGFRFRKNTFDQTVFESVVFQNEYRLPRELKPNDVILDIGGHIGSFAVACHQRGSRRVFCFEPNPENFDIARQNTKDLDGVKLHRAAMLHQAGRVDCDRFPHQQGIANTGGGKVRQNRDGRVRSVAINTILEQLSTVTLLKLDCEGCEWPILLSGTDWNRVEAVCGEYHLFHDFVRGEFGITKTLDPSLLLETLGKHFAHVSVEVPNRDGLGRFWASRKQSFFARAARNTKIFQKSHAGATAGVAPEANR